MLVYRETKQNFMQDVVDDRIAGRITEAFEARLHRAQAGEKRAWKNSMEYMHKVLSTDDISGDCGVAIEFGVPLTPSRIDFVLTGEAGDRGAAVIVELKQWEKLEKVERRDALVRTYVGGAVQEKPHPSYQAWSYARMIEDYNEDVRNRRIDLAPCAYLHNYRAAAAGDPLFDDSYGRYLKEAPAFCQGDVRKLREFIAGEQFRDLPREERRMLVKQEVVMTELVDVLNERITYWRGDDFQLGKACDLSGDGTCEACQ